MGSGKTYQQFAKLANRFKAKAARYGFASRSTFRDAAIEQLECGVTRTTRCHTAIPPVLAIRVRI